MRNLPILLGLILSLPACGDEPSSVAGPVQRISPNDRAHIQEAETAQPSRPDPVEVREHAEGLYLRHCALCHGAHGEGYLADNAPALAGRDFLAVADSAFLEAAIFDGRPGTPMSAWGAQHQGPLTHDDVASIAALIRSWANAPLTVLDRTPLRGDAQHGTSLYRTHCASCHGVYGEGVTAVSLNHPNFLATASDAFIKYAIAHGRAGTRMVAWDPILSDGDITDLVAHIRTMTRPPVDTASWPQERTPAIRRLTIHPRSAPPEFVLRENRFVPAVQVRAAMAAGKRLIILDARATSDWALGHIPGAAPFPFYDADQLTRVLPNDGTWIIAYCACPHAASGHVVDTLRAHGFEHAAVLDEGIDFWRNHGYPMARGIDPATPAAHPRAH